MSTRPLSLAMCSTARMEPEGSDAMQQQSVCHARTFHSIKLRMCGRTHCRCKALRLTFVGQHGSCSQHLVSVTDTVCQRRKLHDPKKHPSSSIVCHDPAECPAHLKCRWCRWAAPQSRRAQG